MLNIIDSNNEDQLDSFYLLLMDSIIFKINEITIKNSLRMNKTFSQELCFGLYFEAINENAKPSKCKITDFKSLCNEYDKKGNFTMNYLIGKGSAYYLLDNNSINFVCLDSNQFDNDFLKEINQSNTNMFKKYLNYISDQSQTNNNNKKPKTAIGEYLFILLSIGFANVFKIVINLCNKLIQSVHEKNLSKKSTEYSKVNVVPQYKTIKVSVRFVLCSCKCIRNSHSKSHY